MVASIAEIVKPEQKIVMPERIGKITEWNPAGYGIISSFHDGADIFLFDEDVLNRDSFSDLTVFREGGLKNRWVLYDRQFNHSKSLDQANNALVFRTGTPRYISNDVFCNQVLENGLVKFSKTNAIPYLSDREFRKDQWVWYQVEVDRFGPRAMILDQATLPDYQNQ